MRLFFGLRPDPQTALDIINWTERALPPMIHPIPVDNLHVTLAFFGKIHDANMEELFQFADQVQSAPIELVIDQLGYWSKQTILWIGPQEPPQEIFRLAKMLSNIRRRMGFRSESREYLPHISIARRCKIPPPASTLQPEFTLYFDRFTLFESIDIKSGKYYRTVQEWKL